MARVVVRDGCWDTELVSAANGYCRFWWKGKRIRLHGASWLAHRGEIPRGMFVLHKCDNRRCANPDHLFLGTIKDNRDDMLRKGRDNPPRGERSAGAKLTAEDVIAIRKDTRSQRDIGRAYGVAASTIGSIRQGVNWAHIGG
jgi:hypothetical protein